MLTPGVDCGAHAFDGLIEGPIEGIAAAAGDDQVERRVDFGAGPFGHIPAPGGVGLFEVAAVDAGDRR